MERNATRIIYQCPYCNRVYFSNEEADDCNKNHLIIKRIVDYTEDEGEHMGKPYKYPHWIMLQMDDGFVYRYRFSHINVVWEDVLPKTKDGIKICEVRYNDISSRQPDIVVIDIEGKRLWYDICYIREVMQPRVLAEEYTREKIFKEIREDEV